MALYEPFALDLLRSHVPLYDLPARAKLPAKLAHELDLPEWLPRILCQNMCFPGTPPPLFGGGQGGTTSSSNTSLSDQDSAEGAAPRRDRAKPAGPAGWQVVCWWRVTKETCDLARSDPSGATWPAHMQVWRRYATHAEKMSVLNGCLKGVARVDNISDPDLGLPRLVRQYNAKPVLMASAALVGERQGVVKVRKAHDNDYLELGLNVGADFAAMSNHALHAMKDKFPRLVCDIGWVVEGRTPAELPEGLVAALRLNYIDLENAVDLETWLNL